MVLVTKSTCGNRAGQDEWMNDEALEDLRESGEKSNTTVVWAFRTIATFEHEDNEGVLPGRREHALYKSKLMLQEFNERIRYLIGSITFMYVQSTTGGLFRNRASLAPIHGDLFLALRVPR